MITQSDPAHIIIGRITSIMTASNNARLEFALGDIKHVADGIREESPWTADILDKAIRNIREYARKREELA